MCRDWLLVGVMVRAVVFRTEIFHGVKVHVVTNHVHFATDIEQ